MAKFSMGDKVTVEATILSDDDDCCGPTYKVEINGHYSTATARAIEEGKLKLVKKAVPPLPPAGTVMAYAPLPNAVYIVLAGGRTTYLAKRSDKAAFTAEAGAFRWEDFDHNLVTILN